MSGMLTLAVLGGVLLVGFLLRTILLAAERRKQKPSRISLVLLVRNREEEIESFWHHLVGLLGARTKPYHTELVVVDDASGDTTPDILRRLLARYPGVKFARRERGAPESPSAVDIGCFLASSPVMVVISLQETPMREVIKGMVSLLGDEVSYPGPFSEKVEEHPSA